MFTTAAAAVVQAISATIPAAAAAAELAPAEPSDMIDIFAYRNDAIPGWHSGTFGAYCPPSHPYLYDKNYAPDRFMVNNGVKVVSDTLIGFSTFPRKHTPVDPADPTGPAYWGGILGDFTNYDVVNRGISVTLVCTSDTGKAWHGQNAPR